MELLRRAGVTFLRGLWTALLPSPERREHAREHGLDAPRWSAGFGFVQGGVGVFLFVAGGIAFFRGVSGDLSQVLLENWQPGLDSTHFRATGLVGWLAWLVWPGSWPWSYLAVVGLARVISFAITREAMGEPVLIPVLRVVQRFAGQRRARRRAAAFGPPRRDRIVPEGAGLVVLSAGDKPGWEPGVTVELEDRYYRLEAVEERIDGAWRCMAYLLVEAGGVSVIRKLFRYDPDRAEKAAPNPPRRGAGTA